MKETDFDQLIKTLKGKRAPFSVVFELTKRCNLRCLHCYLPDGSTRGEDELDLTEIRSVLDDLAKAGCLKLTLTGGEPTLREDFSEIYSYSQKKGFAITLFTNGTLLTPGVRRVLLKTPPLAVECSLYGATPGIHDVITRTPGSFDLSIRTIQWLKTKGIPTFVKTVILSTNLQEIDSLQNLCQGLGVPFHPTFRVFSSLDPGRSPERWRVKTRELKDLLKREGLPFFKSPEAVDPTPEDWICNAGRQACSISAEGKVYPCVALRWESGDLRKASFHEIWDHSPVLETIRSYQEKDFKTCFRCPWKRECHFCPGMGFFEHGNMLKPSREMCRMTKVISSPE